jgi:hypothetical protein
VGQRHILTMNRSFTDLRLSETGQNSSYARLWNTLLGRLDGLRISVQPPLRIENTPTSTMINISPQRRTIGGTVAAENPPFWVYQSSAGKIKITGGFIIYPFGDYYLAIDDTGEESVADGDYIWLEMTGNHAWEFVIGDTIPLDALTWTLAQASVDGDGNVTFDRDWSGRDIVLPASWPVTLEEDGGVQGGGTGGADCTWTYTVTAEDETELLTTATPENANLRIDGVGYGIATCGIAWFADDGSIGFAVLDEYAIVKSQAVVTGVSYNTSTHVLAFTYQTLKVLDTGTSNSSTTVDTAGTC